MATKKSATKPMSEDMKKAALLRKLAAETEHIDPEAKKVLLAKASVLGPGPKPASAPKESAMPKKKKTAEKKTAAKAAPKKATTKKKAATKKAAPKKATTKKKAAAKKSRTQRDEAKALRELHARQKTAAKAAPKKKAKKKTKKKKTAAHAAFPGHAARMRAEATAATAAAAAAAPAAKAKTKTKKKKAKKKTAQVAAAAPAKAKTKTKKKAKKKTKKASVAAAAPKAKTKTKKKAKKKKTKRAAVATATKHAKKKTSSKKKAKKKKRAVTRSSAITVKGKAMRKTAIRAHQGMVRRSTKTTYENPKTGRKLSINHIMRMANPVGNWANVAILGGGAVVGFLLADGIDRLVATRAGDAKYAYYSHDAAQRIMLRPDGMRIAAQAGVTVALFLGSYAAQNRMPKLAYGLAGAAIGAGVHLISQLAIEYLMPKAFSVTKGTERNLGNRLYPMQQDALQDEQQKAIEAENKAPASLPGQQGTDTDLPDSYLYPGQKTASAPPPGTGDNAQKQGGKLSGPSGYRVTPHIVAGVGLGAPQGQARPVPQVRPGLPAPRPQIMYPQAQQAQQPRMVAQPQSHDFLGEPVARAAVRTAPVGVGAQGDCPGCGAGLKRDQDIHDGLNVKAVWPKGAAIDVTNDIPPQGDPSQIRADIAFQTADSGQAAGSGLEMFTPGVQEQMPADGTTGIPAANNRYATNAAGKPRGIMRKPGMQAGLAGTRESDSGGSNFRAGHNLRSHLN